MNKTENLKLNVWEKTDPILVGDFNEDNRKIDAAVAALQGEHIYVGSYTGDGKNSRIIDLPWEPKFAVIFGHVLDDAAVNLLMKTSQRFITSDSCGENDTYNLTMIGKQLVVKSNRWFNGNGQLIQYVLFR